MSETKHEQWLCNFRENGGYDCMTDSFDITRDGHIIVEVDLRLFGQDNCKEATQEQLQEGRKVADIIAAAPDMLAALEAVIKHIHVEKISNSIEFHMIGVDDMAELEPIIDAAIAKAKGGAK